MHDDPGLRVEQANHAIRQLFHQAPNGRIPAEDRTRYDELLNDWLAAVQARDQAGADDEEPARLAA